MSLYDLNRRLLSGETQRPMVQGLDSDTTLRLLKALDMAGIPFGIITNGSTRQNIKIDQLGLRSRTQCIFVSEEFGCSKPDPAIFQAAAACLNAPCESILFRRR